jgi:hypothetical protein
MITLSNLYGGLGSYSQQYNPYSFNSIASIQYPQFNSSVVSPFNFGSSLLDKIVDETTNPAAGISKTKQEKVFATIDYILKYGEKALSILVAAGVIKNKNLETFSAKSDFSESQFDDLLAGRSANVKPPTTPETGKILGLTYQQAGLTVGVIGLSISIYSLIQNKKKRK